jgi:uncharacterized protein (TIGR00661 family)
MKILYAVQATGNGHITRAIEIIPFLQKKGDVDILVSGIQSDIELPFKVKHRLKGISFVFGKKGGINYWKTFLKLQSTTFLKDIKTLNVAQYDLVISDFEPISAWACIKAKKACIGLSNQVATLHPLAPKPIKEDLFGKLILQNYAPTSTNYGFQFKPLTVNMFTPIIRQQVRDLQVSDEGHYVVYLPSYDDIRIIKVLKKIPDVVWKVFSKHSDKEYSIYNITILPIQPKQFLKSLASAKGVLCNAGFGVTSEALFLKKKLLVIPMKKQYEQECNAAVLKEMGVSVINKFNKDHINVIQDWIHNGAIITVDYNDNTEHIIDVIIDNHVSEKAK